MTVGICIIAHAPLASALKTCAMHIYSMTGDTVAERIEAYDVPSTVDTEAGLIEVQQRTRRLLEESHEGVLVFTDISRCHTGKHCSSAARRSAHLRH